MYNPNKIHRKVRRVGATPDGSIEHITKSFTNDEDQWKPEVDAATGFVKCTCPDHLFTCAKHYPHVLSDTDQLCKHVIRAILGCVRRGEITLPEERVNELRRAMHRRGRKKEAQAEGREQAKPKGRGPAPVVAPQTVQQWTAAERKAAIDRMNEI